VALEHGMDLREAVEAAAKAVFDEKGFDDQWESVDVMTRCNFHEAALPAVEAAAKVIRNATLDEVDAQFVAWSEQFMIGSPDFVLLEAQRAEIAKMREV
jgi:hypothetical protein